MTDVVTRYPGGSISPHGAYYLMKGTVPTMKLQSGDGTSLFTLMGGESIPRHYENQETVHLKDMKGLVPPWKQIDQKGATQDGATFVTSLYDPAEVEMTLVVKGRSSRTIRKVVNDLVASVDAINTSQLSWFTPDLGYWWADARWMDTYHDAEAGTRTGRQTVTLRMRAFDSFYRTFDVVDDFRIGHTDAPGDFTVDAAALDPAQWTVATSGGGTGTLTVANGQVVPTLKGGRTAVAKRVGWTGADPIMEIQLGSFSGWYMDSDTSFDFWVMPNVPVAGHSANPGTDGYRMRLSTKSVQLHQVVNGVATLLSEQPLQVPPRSGEYWTFSGGPTFKLSRSGAVVFSFLPATVAAYTAAGFGMSTTGTAVPPGLRSISFGSPASTSQTGYVRFVNWGDQPMPPRFTCVGPGTFSFGNGPLATPDEMVSFGPLYAGQVMQVVTDGRRRGVVDLSSAPAGQDVPAWTQAYNDLLSFFTTTGGINSYIALADDFFTQTAIAILEDSGLAGTPLLQSIKSQFGILPPQGNPYTLLQGRFSKAAFIPAKPAGRPPKEWHIPVSITGGTVDSQIIAAGTPLRRLPY